MRKKINLFLGGIIALLSGCNTPKKALKEPRVVAIYGVPYATYYVEGNVVDQTDKPIKGANVIVKGYGNRIISDTLVTDKQGAFNTVVSDFPTDTINIVVSNSKDGLPTDSTQHSTKFETNEAKGGFYRGESHIKTTITIQK
jgi:putative lipoprotein (rSAM/lipoprotein system)